LFIIHVNYIKSLDVVDQYLNAHRTYLDSGYAKNHFIASGPKNPRTGGVIISQLKNRDELQDILKQDPFYMHGIAEYVIEEFTPVKYHAEFASFVQ